VLYPQNGDRIVTIDSVMSVYPTYTPLGGSVAEWSACWTQAQKARVQIAVATLSGNSLRQTAHTHCASVHQAAKLVVVVVVVTFFNHNFVNCKATLILAIKIYGASLLRVAGVTAGLAKSNGSLPPGL